MKPILFLFFLFAGLSNSFSQDCPEVLPGIKKCDVLAFVVGPNCDTGNCLTLDIGIGTQILEATLSVPAAVIGHETVSYKDGAAKDCNDKLYLDVGDFSGYAFLEYFQLFEDGTYKKYKEVVYIINEKGNKKVSDIKIVQDVSKDRRLKPASLPSGK